MEEPTGDGRPTTRREHALSAARERVRHNNEVADHNTREHFIDAAQKAALHNPQIDQQIFRDIIAAYDADGDQYRNELDAARREAPDGRYYQQAAMQARQGLMARVRERISHHGAAGQAAMGAIYSEMQPESIFTPVVRQFYNSDNGGLQIGGTLGAAALGGLAFYLTKGSSWLITGAATLVAGVLGAYVGNKIAGVPSTPPNLPNFRAPAPPTPARSPVVGSGMPTVTVSNQIQPAPLTGNETREFSATPTPVVVDNSNGMPGNTRFNV
jgi:hypothetical protein